MKLKNASIITFNDSEVEIEDTDKIINSEIHMYYYHIRPPNFDLTSKTIHFIVKAMKNFMDLIHGLESGFKPCCIMSYLRGKAKFIRPEHQYFCHKCLAKYKAGTYEDRRRLSIIKNKSFNI